MPYKQFLGYEKGEDGHPQIVESEAEIVRTIYSLFIEGKTPSSIARHLINYGIPTPGGKKIWQVSTVKSIITNEKYRGDAVLQKSFTVDFLTKRKKVNEGEVPQYYVENSHAAIIDPQEFDAAQAEMERRKKLGRPSACNSPLSTKLVCGDCGGFYGAKVWGSNTKYRKVIWRCNNKYKRDEKCSTPHVTEEKVRQKFLTAFNSVLAYRSELIANCRLAQKALCDSSGLTAEMSALRQEIAVVAELARKTILVEAHASKAEGEGLNQNGDYLERHSKAVMRLAELENLKREKQIKSSALESFIQSIENRKECLDTFDERLWAAVVDKVVIMQDDKLLFRFRDGTEIAV